MHRRPNAIGLPSFFVMLFLLLTAADGWAQPHDDDLEGPPPPVQEEPSRWPVVYDLTAPDPRTAQAPPLVPLDGPGSADLNGLAPDRITLGTWAPRSGPWAPHGALTRGLATYFKAINLQGGLGGRTIQLLSFDGRDDAEWTMEGIRVLADHYGVLAMVAGVGPVSNLAAFEPLARRGIPWIGPVGGLPQYAQPPRPLVFAITPPTTEEAAALVQYSIDYLNRNRVACLYSDDEYGRAGLEGVRFQAKRYQLELAGALALPPGSTDVKNQLIELMEAKPDAVALWVSPVQAAGLIKTLPRLTRLDSAEPLDTVFLAGQGLADAPLMDRLTGGAWTGVVFASTQEAPDDASPLMASYRNAFQRLAARGERWSPFFCSGFGVGEVTLEALRRAGPEPNRARLVRSLESLKTFKGILGRITFGPGQRQGSREMFLVQALEKGNVRPLTGWFTYSMN